MGLGVALFEARRRGGLGLVMPSPEPRAFEHVLHEARGLGLRDVADPRWATVLPRWLPSVAECEAFVAWAREHPRWSFNVADVTAGVCAKPREAAVAVLADIVAELLDDDA